MPSTLTGTHQPQRSSSRSFHGAPWVVMSQRSETALYGLEIDNLRPAGFRFRADARKYFKVSVTESPSVSRATLAFHLHADSTA